jgi:segregation and condensation protein A
VAVPHNQDLLEAESSGSTFSVSLGNFEGPFDLLLSLISKHQMDITEISLSRVTDEFIAYLKQLDQDEELEQASEFLVIAATLLDLKIAGLLPKGEVVDAEDVALLEARDLLFARLLQYRAFKEISTWFAASIAREDSRFARSVRLEERFGQAKPELVWTTTAEEFAKIAEEALTPKEIPSVGLTHLHVSKVNIREQAGEVVKLLRAKRKVSFFDLIADVRERAVVIARFLSVLELYRLAAINFTQDGPLADLSLEWADDNFDENRLDTLGAEYDE